MEPLSYRLFDPSACDFPAPRVPLLPMFTGNRLKPTLASGFELVGKGRERRVYTRGRYALYDAYRLSGVGPDGALLAPAYHCRTMLDPAISLKSELLLYAVDEQLAPDLDALTHLVKKARSPVRAMLLTHYFGFAQHTEPVRRFCSENAIALIEDCSHALFNMSSGPRLGQHGNFTIASPYKLLPCEEGGLLIPGPGAGMPAKPNRPAGLRAELRVLVTAMQRKLRHVRDRTRGTRVAALDDELAHLANVSVSGASEGTATLAGTSSMYVEAEQGLAGPVTARWLMNLCDVDHAARRRRANYERWRSAISTLPHCRALFATLPDDCVPYMFPLLIDHPASHFYTLKRLGVPIWRWDEMALSDCSVAARYSRHLLHLPCHQALEEPELDWMIAAVTQVMRAPAPAG